jgi:hypothetical protein
MEVCPYWREESIVERGPKRAGGRRVTPIAQEDCYENRTL